MRDATPNTLPVQNTLFDLYGVTVNPSLAPPKRSKKRTGRAATQEIIPPPRGRPVPSPQTQTDEITTYQHFEGALFRSKTGSVILPATYINFRKGKPAGTIPPLFAWGLKKLAKVTVTRAIMFGGCFLAGVGVDGRLNRLENPQGPRIHYVQPEPLIPAKAIELAKPKKAIQKRVPEPTKTPIQKFDDALIKFGKWITGP